jgi:hypothetical protein
MVRIHALLFSTQTGSFLATKLSLLNQPCTTTSACMTYRPLLYWHEHVTIVYTYNCTWCSRGERLSGYARNKMHKILIGILRGSQTVGCVDSTQRLTPCPFGFFKIQVSKFRTLKNPDLGGSKKSRSLVHSNKTKIQVSNS